MACGDDISSGSQEDDKSQIDENNTANGKDDVGNTETCDDDTQNQDEEGVDCGGPCDACETVPEPTCTDDIQNQGEEGTDCGGPCDACETMPVQTCTDGIQNQAETGVDCGGPCDACETTPVPTCTDGLQNQGEEGVDCGGPCLGCIVPDAKRIFLTSQKYDGNFRTPVDSDDGILGGDNICAKHARLAGIEGNFMAWLSAEDVDATERLLEVGPWYKMDQRTLIFESLELALWNGPEAPFNMDENGEEVHPADSAFWSNTDSDGNYFGINCSNFSSAGLVEEGLKGASYYYDSIPGTTWTETTTQPCNYESRILCFEQ